MVPGSKEAIILSFCHIKVDYLVSLLHESHPKLVLIDPPLLPIPAPQLRLAEDLCLT
jgi:hypothetical protein